MRGVNKYRGFPRDIQYGGEFRKWRELALPLPEHSATRQACVQEMTTSQGDQGQSESRRECPNCQIKRDMREWVFFDILARYGSSQSESLRSRHQWLCPAAGFQVDTYRAPWRNASGRPLSSECSRSALACMRISTGSTPWKYDIFLEAKDSSLARPYGVYSNGCSSGSACGFSGELTGGGLRSLEDCPRSQNLPSIGLHFTKNACIFPPVQSDRPVGDLYGCSRRGGSRIDLVGDLLQPHLEYD